ncbi:phospholipase D family protein [Halioglobus maricola]|uniref:Phospholipase D family protein n=1 Tax=Halioglobus maricola TaxID=2601894 RepID=A0A5P9NLF7_9GAMM|nr:phospholipase D family protein [Halioglobus maricola]QFU76336.1 phospholipase D family protein [Halioglobus maricola]
MQNFWCRQLGLAFVVFAMIACSAPVQRHDHLAQPAAIASSDQFWRHIDAAGGHDWFHLLNGSEEALAWRLAMIDSAHHQIDMETFLWKEDEAGQKILAHLLAAADRGVQVRVLLDDSFTPHQDLVLSRIAHHPRIQLRVYNPYGNRSGGMLSRMVFNLDDFLRVNHRLHNKTLTVDGWAVIVGGRNLADEYFGLHRDYNFRDMEVLAMGSGVASVSQHFADFWNSGWSVPVEATVFIKEGDEALVRLRQKLAAAVGDVQVADDTELGERWREAATGALPGKATLIADSPALEDPSREAPRQLAGQLVELINAAEKDVVLVSAYLVPTAELSDAIAQARARGVRVRILTNSLRSNNHLAAHAAYSGYIRELLQEGVELYEVRVDASDRQLYMRSPVAEKELGLHAKFMLFDFDRIFIGSSNLDPRSLELNTEVGLLIESEAFNSELRAAIAIDFEPANSWQVALDESGHLQWRGLNETLHQSPADSEFQRLEDWFIGLLPVDANM